MNYWAQMLILVTVLFLTLGFATNCGSFGRGNTGTDRPEEPARFPTDTTGVSPVDQSPDPVMLGDMDLRDAVREFKKLLGRGISVSKVVLESDSVTISVQNSGDFRFAAGVVTKVPSGTAHLRYIQAFSNMVPIRSFELDQTPFVMVPKIAATVPKIIWIDGGKVDKIEIAAPANWTVTVGGTQNQVVHRLNVGPASFGVYDDGYLRPYAGFLTDPVALREKVAGIKEYVGGKLEVLSLGIHSNTVSVKARDQRKPDEFNEIDFNEKGKWTESPVRESELRIRPGDLGLDPQVRSLADMVFNADDLDLSLVSHMAEAALDKLRLEKSSVSRVDIVGNYNKNLKWRVMVTADNGRRSGTAYFDLNGALLEAKQQ
ncbi:MAG: hypothetical protein ABIU09_06865 [Pyrinomonadaceae bacterium]